MHLPAGLGTARNVKDKLSRKLVAQHPLSTDHAMADNAIQRVRFNVNQVVLDVPAQASPSHGVLRSAHICDNGRVFG